jgi:hypothetical protein
MMKRLGVVAVSFAAVSAFSFLAPATAASTPSLAQLSAALKVSAAATKVPNLTKTIPPLASLSSANNVPPGMNGHCYVQNGTESAVPSNAATLCAWGDKSSNKTLYAFGDSQASMWLNALIPVLTSLKWRIVETAQTGCPPWPDQSAVSETGTDEAACVAWDASELAFEKQLKPQVVIAMGDGFHAGTGKYATEAQFAAGAADLVKAVAPARIVFLSPIPMYSTDMKLPYVSPSECLVSASSLKSCDFSPSQLVEALQFDAWQATAKATHQRFIDVTPMSCTSKSCPVIVDDKGERLVYVDGSHATRTYMLFVASAFEQLLKPDL